MVTATDFKLADVKVESSKAYLLKLRENLSWDLKVLYIFVQKYGCKYMPMSRKNLYLQENKDHNRKVPPVSLVGAFPLRSVCVPLINMHKGRVHNVTRCYNPEKKCVPPY